MTAWWMRKRWRFWTFPCLRRSKNGFGRKVCYQVCEWVWKVIGLRRVKWWWQSEVFGLVSLWSSMWMNSPHSHWQLLPKRDLLGWIFPDRKHFFFYCTEFGSDALPSRFINWKSNQLDCPWSFLYGCSIWSKSNPRDHELLQVFVISCLIRIN